MGAMTTPVMLDYPMHTVVVNVAIAQPNLPNKNRAIRHERAAHEGLDFSHSRTKEDPFSQRKR